MKARYSYRCYPNSIQRRQLARLFGSVRVVFNDALSLCKNSDKLPSNAQLQKICITQAKKTDARHWLSEVSNIPLQQSVMDLGVAYKNFFDSCSGKRLGKRVGYPRFKRKHNRQSARFRKGGFRVKGNKVYLAKVGNLKVRWSRALPSPPSSVTIIKDRANRYFLSFVVETQPVIITDKNESLGIDLGIKIFAALSSGRMVYAPDYSKLEGKIRRIKRRLSKRVSGSKRYEIMRVRLARITSKLAAVRKDFLDKLSTKVTKENKLVALEDLAVGNMLKNRSLSRAIATQGWGMFRSLCESKADKYGCDVRIISRWSPTSQVCSSCGYKWGKLDLKVREIVCLGCGTRKNRDRNAAENIEQVAVGDGQTHDLKRTGSECKTTVVADRVEPSAHLIVEKNGQLCLFSSLE